MQDRITTTAIAAAEAARDPHRLLGFRLPLLVNIWSALATRRFARKFGLKQLEARVLFVVGINGAVSLKSVGQFAGIEKAYASRTAASLVASGMIAKTTDTRDRRSVLLELTPVGQSMFDAILEDANARDDEWISVLNASERRNLHVYLDRLQKRLDALVRLERDGRPTAEE